jgi:hypothetical protein
MAVISMVFDPLLDPAMIMSKLYVAKPILGSSDAPEVFSDDLISVVTSYSKRAA